MSNNAGERTCLVTIERHAPGVDAANQPVDVWEFVMKRWARPLTASGMSAVRAAEQGVPAVLGRYSWRINFTPQGIDVGMRLNYKGTIFDISDVRHDYANKGYTDIVCEQGGNRG